MKRCTILLVGGGTVGHIAPLIAIAEELAHQAEESGIALSLHYVGEAADKESPVWQQGRLTIEKHVIVAGKLNRFVTWKHLGQAGRLAKGFWQADRLIKRLKPDVVMAKGGYVCVPVVWAASMRSIPVYAHETDLIPGMTNRLIARLAKRVFTAFPADRYHTLHNKSVVYVGQPVRSVFYEPDHGMDLLLNGRIIDPDQPLLTVIGGSQGAHRINTLVHASWPTLLEKTQLLHLCGPHDYEDLSKEAMQLPGELGKNLYLFSGIYTEFALAIRRSTLVLSRSGGTIFELAATGVPVILIPLPTAAQDHQRANALLLQKEGAAEVLEEAGLTAERLQNTVLALLEDAEKRSSLSTAIRQFARPDAAAEIARIIWKDWSEKKYE
jgi:UDP-N-acetylglucosamine--N-acetylmuramyl-(pentapeptide) pyrophosphoryl-undecaprenol N-acetylglucosamine transferase